MRTAVNAIMGSFTGGHISGLCANVRRVLMIGLASDNHAAFNGQGGELHLRLFWRGSRLCRMICRCHHFLTPYVDRQAAIPRRLAGARTEEAATR
jgi:hypothetical protein